MTCIIFWSFYSHRESYGCAENAHGILHDGGSNFMRTSVYGLRFNLGIAYTGFKAFLN